MSEYDYEEGWNVATESFDWDITFDDLKFIESLETGEVAIEEYHMDALSDILERAGIDADDVVQESFALVSTGIFMGMVALATAAATAVYLAVRYIKRKIQSAVAWLPKNTDKLPAWTHKPIDALAPILVKLAGEKTVSESKGESKSSSDTTKEDAERKKKAEKEAEVRAELSEKRKERHAKDKKEQDDLKEKHDEEEKRLRAKQAKEIEKAEEEEKKKVLKAEEESDKKLKEADEKLKEIDDARRAEDFRKEKKAAAVKLVADAKEGMRTTISRLKEQHKAKVNYVTDDHIKTAKELLEEINKPNSAEADLARQINKFRYERILDGVYDKGFKLDANLFFAAFVGEEGDDAVMLVPDRSSWPESNFNTDIGKVMPMLPRSMNKYVRTALRLSEEVKDDLKESDKITEDWIKGTGYTLISNIKDIMGSLNGDIDGYLSNTQEPITKLNLHDSLYAIFAPEEGRVLKVRPQTQENNITGGALQHLPSINVFAPDANIPCIFIPASTQLDPKAVADVSRVVKSVSKELGKMEGEVTKLFDQIKKIDNIDNKLESYASMVRNRAASGKTGKLPRVIEAGIHSDQNTKYQALIKKLGDDGAYIKEAVGVITKASKISSGVNKHFSDFTQIVAKEIYSKKSGIGRAGAATDQLTELMVNIKDDERRAFLEYLTTYKQ